MNYTILMGSPNRDGNTAALLRPFMEENQSLGIDQNIVWLYEKKIHPCVGCKVCQDISSGFGCVHQDAAAAIYEAIKASDLTVFATPIYSWYCTAPMKALMDRLIYAGCKYYGEKRYGSTLTGTRIATITTCGYRPEKGADVWEDGLKRWCRHGEMEYLGMFCHRDIGQKALFMNEQVEMEVRGFARTLHTTLGSQG